ncbi:hypothetical protein AA310_01810 [Arthrobacter sp. YC-RL1]|uniref:SGNH/GDSL hydrolase family protein n=1 Tax=Arthrobacter sp. YC-RL1 TaxID=1652545 RepID=UPI00063DD788|nr:hypothetical protein [Arthrobacter sp. YC-RL1]ALQ31829.1 hypothetical protein ATC04_15620 [Arthrobacter sp. YC-RL1]KLI90144.1 hypothetical protein AA310_01810 [Arthrobacter sp. YC-RL1]
MPETPLGIPTPADSVKISQLAASIRAAAGKIDDLLQGGLTPELIEAATQVAVDAVQDAAIQLDFITGSDDRVLRTTNELNYAIPFADDDGYTAGGFYDSGEFNTEMPPLIQGQTGMVGQPVNAPGWQTVVTDEDGVVAFGIRDDGYTHISYGNIAPQDSANTAVGYTRSQRNRVACIGDSLTYGYFDGSAGPTSDSYPAKLADLVPAGVDVFNLGTSGWCVDEVAVRIGAIPVPLTATLNRIPASGPVNVITDEVIGFRALGSAVSFPGTLAGVPGILRRQDSNTLLTFTRSTAGTEVPLEPGTVFVPDMTGHDADTSIILLGRNDIALGVTGAESSVAEHIIAGVQRIVNWHTRQLKQVLVVPPTTTVGEEAGTAGYVTATTVRDGLQLAYGPKCYDLRHELVHEAIYEQGITPTPTDLAKMTADTLPPSIMDPGDGTHWSRQTAVWVAARFNTYMTQREWIRP